MTKTQQATSFLTHASQWLVGPSIALNIFFMSDIYQTIKEIPVEHSKNEQIHLQFKEKINKFEYKFRQQGVWNKETDAILYDIAPKVQVLMPPRTQIED